MHIALLVLLGAVAWSVVSVVVAVAVGGMARARDAALRPDLAIDLSDGAAYDEGLRAAG